LTCGKKLKHDRPQTVVKCPQCSQRIIVPNPSTPSGPEQTPTFDRSSDRAELLGLVKDEGLPPMPRARFPWKTSLAAVAILACLVAGALFLKNAVIEALKPSATDNGPGSPAPSPPSVAKYVQNAASKKVEEEEEPQIPPKAMPSAGNSGAIRLSGIHGSGLQECDIDLWKNNPVEADLKWKGKIVEVTMDLDDLRIVQNAVGDQGALETPPDEIGRKDVWRSLAWQKSIFIFQGENRKQLVGLQNFSGTVKIRGKSCGLEGTGSYATFDDCVLVADPDQAANRASNLGQLEIHIALLDRTLDTIERSDSIGLPADKQKTDQDAKFDAKDFDVFREWLINKSFTVEKETNGIVRKELLDKAQAELSSHKAQRIQWTFIVTSAGETVAFTNAKTGESWPGRRIDAELAVGKGITREKARQLHGGDKIILTGEINDLRLTKENTLGGWATTGRLRLVKVNAEPAPSQRPDEGAKLVIDVPWDESGPTIDALNMQRRNKRAKAGAKFDPKNQSACYDWLLARSRSFMDETNGIRRQELFDECNKELASKVGQSVEWEFVVLAAGQTVDFKSPDFTPGDHPTQFLRLAAGSGVSREKASKLHLGDKITVTGDIAAMRFIQGNPLKIHVELAKVKVLE
jgi:hypothetical protein